MIVILDTGIIGIITNPNNSPETIECENWLYGLFSRGARIISSDICDYEIRRGLELACININNKSPYISLLANKRGGIEKLDELRNILEFLPVSFSLLERASYLWGKSRSISQPLSSNSVLDVDIILCAQWEILSEENPGREIIIATKNVRDLGRYANADIFENIYF